MKKKLILLIIVITSLLIFSGCQEDILTYENSGTITLTILNADIDATDVTVFCSDENAEVEKDGKDIIITQDKMLRIMVILEVDDEAGDYITESVLISSGDFNSTFTYQQDVTFQEDYILMELNVNTNADYEDISITSDDLISITPNGDIYDIKLERTANPELLISAGDGYKDYTLTLSEIEIASGVCSKAIMLLEEDYALLELALADGLRASVWTEEYDQIMRSENGNNSSYGIPKDRDVYINITDNNYYYAHNVITTEQMDEQDTFIYTLDDMLYNINYEVTPYFDSNITGTRWLVIAEKVGEDEYEYLNDEEYYGTINGYDTFDNTKEYYLFCMSGDGKVRYREMDLSLSEFYDYGNRRLVMQFIEDDPVLEMEVQIIDHLGETTDFSGVTLNSNANPNEYLGAISSGDTLQINPNQSFSSILLGNLPSGYQQDQNSNFYETLIEEGILVIYVYHYIDLNLLIDSEESLEGQDIYGKSFHYHIDEFNSTLITNYYYENANYYAEYSLYYNDQSYIIDICSLL